VCGVAVWAAELGSLIEVVNKFGSYFYGSILGVFVLAFIPRANATGALFGLAGAWVWSVLAATVYERRVSLAQRDGRCRRARRRE
jgi:hypothetical protein